MTWQQTGLTTWRSPDTSCMHRLVQESLWGKLTGLTRRGPIWPVEALSAMWISTRRNGSPARSGMRRVRPMWSGSQRLPPRVRR
ncbi:Uncharacterised protein [Mycobacteroides abscessus subsp. abscessus]|nr:Uncharacterised protein [Mycobacteroides abscessus subsp. abscessus]